MDVRLEQQVEVPQLRIRGDRTLLARYGLTVGDLAETIDVAFGGLAVSEILEDGRSHDLVVRLPDAVIFLILFSDPLAIRGGEPGSEIQSPMAVVILGGLLSSTALNMVVLPALYWVMGGDRAPARTEL